MVSQPNGDAYLEMLLSGVTALPTNVFVELTPISIRTPLPFSYSTGRSAPSAADLNLYREDDCELILVRDSSVPHENERPRNSSLHTKRRPGIQSMGESCGTRRNRLEIVRRRITCSDCALLTVDMLIATSYTSSCNASISLSSSSSSLRPSQCRPLRACIAYG